MAEAGREPRQAGTRPTFLSTAVRHPLSTCEQRLNVSTAEVYLDDPQGSITDLGVSFTEEAQKGPTGVMAMEGF